MGHCQTPGLAVVAASPALGAPRSLTSRPPPPVAMARQAWKPLLSDVPHHRTSHPLCWFDHQHHHLHVNVQSLLLQLPWACHSLRDDTPITQHCLPPHLPHNKQLPLAPSQPTVHCSLPNQKKTGPVCHSHPCASP